MTKAKGQVKKQLWREQLKRAQRGTISDRIFELEDLMVEGADTQMISALIKQMLTDPSARVQRFIARHIRVFGIEAVSPILDVIQKQDPIICEVQQMLLTAIRQVRTAAYPLIVEALQAGRVTRQLGAIYALSEIYRRDDLKPLTSLLHHHDSRVRKAAVQALEKSDDVSVAEQVMEVMRSDEDDKVRKAARQTVKSIYSKSGAKTPKLPTITEITRRPLSQQCGEPDAIPASRPYPWHISEGDVFVAPSRQHLISGRSSLPAPPVAKPPSGECCFDDEPPDEADDL
ncbi:MAG: HEAT repeat domain-containing protein [Candidatus Viridilinea halotolerans]|uniref:HEAT repeat domain-containing protein n=1 Tax=Candidatus Viridilinea halotolerans TaxID=2491704 RepID=A0A426U2S0_9CHLR|nr:MAG: HEAT repeat domain-containing protein [Candidatus Viridilinea halotolerans]